MGGSASLPHAPPSTAPGDVLRSLQLLLLGAPLDQLPLPLLAARGCATVQRSVLLLDLYRLLGDCGTTCTQLLAGHAAAEDSAVNQVGSRGF